MSLMGSIQCVCSSIMHGQIIMERVEIDLGYYTVQLRIGYNIQQILFQTSRLYLGKCSFLMKNANCSSTFQLFHIIKICLNFKFYYMKIIFYF